MSRRIATLYVFIDIIRAILHHAQMAQMNISMPDKLKSWVEAQVADGGYASSSDYVRDLVRRDQRARQALSDLQAEIDLGRASGVSDRNLADIVDAVRKQRA